MRCEECGIDYELEGPRKRLWPKVCEPCFAARRSKGDDAPHIIGEYPFVGYNFQLGRNITGRAHEREVCREIAEKSQGRVVPDWH